MSDFSGELEQAALSLASSLKRSGDRIVFAESCTGGLVAATLGSIPGISQHFCGSAVTYRGATKVAWLGVNATDVERDDAVNEAVASQMAEAVLAKTPESTLAVSVTGHVGPDAPPDLDGVIYIGAARALHCQVSRHRLTSNLRRERQREAATLVLEAARQLSDHAITR